MPEIKNTFTSGKMNKDLDERLVPNGEYRDAMNVEVASSDSDTVGALTNSKGNAAMNSTGIAGATCVGSIVDTENDRIIWFISGNNTDAIVEYDLLSNDISPILVDANKNNNNAILGFSDNNYITGINILNGILFWTDNVGEPKKINIETMKNGLVDTIDGEIYTQVSNGGFTNPVTEWTATDPANTDLANGHVQFSGAQNADISIYQNITGLANNTSVKVTFEVSTYAFGQVRVRLPGAVGAWITPTASSSHTVILTGNTGNEFHLEVDSAGSMIIDNVIMTKDTFSLNDSVVFGNSLGSRFSTVPSNASDIKVFVDGVEDTSFTYTSPNVTLSSVPSLNSDIKVELASKLAIFAQKTFYIINGFNRNIPRARDITVARRFPLNAPSVTLSDTTRDGVVSNVPVYTIPQTPSPNPSSIIIPNYRFWLYKDANGAILTKPPGVNTTGPFFQNTNTNPPSNKLVDESGDDVRVYELYFQGSHAFQEGDIINLSATNNALAEDNTGPLQVRVLLNTFSANSGRFDFTILSISNSLLDVLGGGVVGETGISWQATLEQETGIYENVFPRFAYRWKYADGEYSAMSPFTEVAFLPSPSGYEYDSEEGHNLAMVNHVKRIVLSNFDYKAVDAVEVDILVKNSNSNNVYVAQTIQTNKQLGDINTTEGLLNGIGDVEILQETILSILPSNQLLRHYDNVPTKALAQEVSANRIIYGNYFQQRDVPSYFEKRVKLNFNAISTDIAGEYSKSVKSIREYQVGVSFLDQFGRHTPVFSSSKAVLKIGQINSNTKNLLTASLQSTPPSWATHLKYYIKENSEEYYNIALDRYYNDDVDGNVWLSFASNETNKVSEDDYIILKKAHGSNDVVYNANGDTVKYKVLAKQSEAPDSIKYKKESLGFANSVTFGRPDGSGTATATNYPQIQSITIDIAYSVLSNTTLEDVSTWTTGPKEKYLKISKPTDSIQSDFYEVSNVTRTPGTGASDYYTFTLKTPLQKDIGFLRTFNVDGSPNPDNGTFKLEYFENVNNELRSEFKGRFFLKIKSDEFLKEYVLETQNTSSALNYVSAAQNMRLIEWDGGGTTTGFTVDNNDYDITNFVFGTIPDYDSTQGSLPSTFNLNPMRNSKVQYWAVDKAQAWAKDDDQSGSGVTGDGFEASQTRVSFRFFGRIPSFYNFGRGWNYNAYNFVDKLNQSSFNPDTFSFYEKMAKGVGLKFRWYDDPDNIYTVVSSTIEPVKNFTSSVNSSATGLEAVNGIRFNFTLDKSVVNGLSSFKILSNSANNTGDNTKILQIIETLPNDDSFFTKDAAIFEIEPKEQAADLNLFYETPNSILIPKVGYNITCTTNSDFPTTTIIQVNTDPVLQINLNSAVTADIPAGTVVKMYNGGNYRSNYFGTDFVQDFVIAKDISNGGAVVELSPVNLNWFNCFAFGNGVESNRIRDDFNAPIIDKGPKVSSTFSGTYKEENIKTGLIYSGIFSNKNGVNNSNQFIQAEKITKQLSPEYGSIQKLFTRNTNMVTFCEDKTVKVLVDKNALFNADGNPQLLATDSVLGQVIPFVGDYGISKNPESFANYGYRVYYTDQKKGAVLRLSGDGITNIAEKGMLDYFKKNIKGSNFILGSYDETKDTYNLTLKYKDTSLNKTVSFTERVNGWTSFKSFIPESGVSLNGAYYTIYNGELWKHGVNEERNTYYGTFTASKVKFIFNTSFSSVKTFRTLNYEGTTSRVYSTVSGQEDQVETKGWYNNSITTDLDSGTIPYFLDKENKWFNYIQGNSTGTTTNDISEKSFQGLGFVKAGGSTSDYYELTLNGHLIDNSLDHQAIYDWAGGDGVPNGTKTTVVNSIAGSNPTAQVFIIRPRIINNVRYVIAGADFSEDTTYTSTGIGSITFADSTATPYSNDNLVYVTINFDTAMPTNDESRSFRIIGSARPEPVTL